MMLTNSNNKQIITITQRAADKISELLKSRGSESLGIRLNVKSGGCSGFSYEIEYADSQTKFDEIVEDKGVRIFIDPKALLFILNTEMDFIEDQFKSGFMFNNPNEKGKCGCGNSFSV